MNKILILDIEWRPTKAYVWQAWKQDITPDKIIEHGGLLCFAAKFLGSREVTFCSDWTCGHEEMLKKAHALLSEADAVVTYNGDKYDLPKLMGEFALAGMEAPPPVTSIDVIKTVKKFGLFMNRLAFVGPMFKVGGKVKHHGFSLWVDIEKGVESAKKTMEKYNIQDVILLEKLYKKIKSFIRNHPHIGDRGACGACDGKILHSRGYRRTKAYKIQRLQCQTCGSWQDGKREKVS